MSLLEWIEEHVHIHENCKNNECGCIEYENGDYELCLGGDYLASGLSLEGFIRERDLTI